MKSEKPIEWIKNSHARSSLKDESLKEIFNPELSHRIRLFHREIPGYKMSPLKGLPNLADRLGLGGIWIKDESSRLDLSSFKVLGGSYAIYQQLKHRLGLTEKEISFTNMMSSSVHEKLGPVIFATATDGNHGRGIAWSAKQMGFESVIYVHKYTSRERIQAIEFNGGRVVVVDGNYDDAVRQVYHDAQKNGWDVISDTSWQGYEDVPKWVMQGYTTLYNEAQEQLSGQGLSKPTHIFIQAGVGSLAAATVGYYDMLFGKERPYSVVVEPTKAACLFESARIDDGKPHSVVGDLDTIMAGLACGDPSPLAWKILREYADYFAICPDYVAAKGMRVYGVPLRGDPFIVSGESGAVTLGALMYIMEYEGAKSLRDQLKLDLDSQVLLVNTEGNTSPDDFRRVVWDGNLPVPDEYRIPY